MPDKSNRPARRKAGRTGADKVMVSRRINRQLWQRLQDYAAGLRPVVTDTAILETALEDYLDRMQKGTEGRST